MKKRHILYAVLLLVAATMALAWVARARLAAEIAQRYFAQHGIESSLDISALDFSGLSGRFTLGPANAPDLAADHIQLIFDPLRLKPRVIEVRLVHPVIRARIGADGKVTLGSLQAWIDDLQSRPGQSDYVSDTLAIALDGMEVHLATPGGALSVDGDVRLVQNLPVRAALRLKPAHIVYNGIDADLTAARLDYDQARQSLSAQFSGTLRTPTAAAQNIDATLEASGLHGNGSPLRITASTLNLHATAASLNPGIAIGHPVLTVVAHDASFADATLRADINVAVQTGIAPPLEAVRAADPALAAVLARNFKQLALVFSGTTRASAQSGQFTLTKGLIVTGAAKALLRVPSLNVQWSGTPLALKLETQASLSGPGLPAVKLALRKGRWQNGQATAAVTLATQFSLAALQNVDLAASGTLHSASGHIDFKSDGCARLALAAFHPGAKDQSSDLASHVQTGLCNALVQADATGWTFTGDTKDASADLPLVNARAEGVFAHLSFRGKGAPQSGDATITNAIVGDRTALARFKPVTITGTAALASQAWTGRLAAVKQDAHAAITFQHALATGRGQAHIDAPSLNFAPGKFQPNDILPLLASLRQANGTAAFSGDLVWTPDTLTSSGKLSLAGLDFLSPIGPVHTIKTELALDSLLPPSAAPGQHIAIARIDWTLPLTAMSLVLGFTPSTLTIASADTGIAQGRASLDPLSVNLADLTHISGTVHLNHIALEDLIAASNLSDKIKLVGKISGTVPFTLSPEGLHIANGHVIADGAGRLEVNRALWTQGGSIAANAVQDFAYQALEHMAFDQLSADLNSITGGRLQIVFHVKGHSDPPQLQKAEVAISDLIAGTALQKPIPLPSNTPIDLTLDTSLNFDELLKSYTEAWSKSLGPGPEAK